MKEVSYADATIRFGKMLMKAVYCHKSRLEEMTLEELRDVGQAYACGVSIVSMGCAAKGLDGAHNHMSEHIEGVVDTE